MQIIVFVVLQIIDVVLRKLFNTNRSLMLDRMSGLDQIFLCFIASAFEQRY